MARNIQSLLRITSNVFQKNITQNICVSGTRMLYAPTALGLDGYKKTRENIKQQFLSMSDKFREKMQSHVNEDSNNMIFTEDLKNILHLVDNSPEDIELLLKMMIKFNKQNKELRFGSYVFGPVVMRAYYFLDKPDEALAAFNDPELEGFFDQLISSQILMDLLYNHERYSDLKQVFETIIAKNTDYTKYPRQLITLVFAGCYRENNPDSMKYAVDLWQVLKEQGSFPMRRASTFFAGLALNQGKSDIAIEVLFNVKQGTYITVRNLKVLALAKLNRLEDIVPILRMSLASDNPTQVKQMYTPEVIQNIEEAIDRAETGNTESIANMVRQLKQNGHIVDNKLDDLITAEIAGYTRTDNRNSTSNNYQSNNLQQSRRPYRQFVQNQRPGLKELV